MTSYDVHTHIKLKPILQPHWQLHRARAMLRLRNRELTTRRKFCTNELSLALNLGRKWPSHLSASRIGYSCLQEQKAIKDIRKSNEQEEQTTEWTLKIGQMKLTRGYYFTDAQSRARAIPKSAYHPLIPSSSIPPCSRATMLTSNHELQKPNPDEAHRNKLSVMTKPVTHSLIQSS
jgi:hypothetical protein